MVDVLYLKINYVKCDPPLLTIWVRRVCVCWLIIKSCQCLVYALQKGIKEFEGSY